MWLVSRVNLHTLIHLINIYWSLIIAVYYSKYGGNKSDYQRHVPCHHDAYHPVTFCAHRQYINQLLVVTKYHRKINQEEIFTLAQF